MLDEEVLKQDSDEPQNGAPSLEQDYDEFAPESDHDKNLAEDLPEELLDTIAAELLEDIAADDASRDEWLQLREQAIGLLGLKVIPPKSDVTSGGAAFDGMSTYQDSSLLEACVRFQANARGELLPASGPVKVVNNDAPLMLNDQMADALEKAINVFLTVGSPEYVPDTDRLFFQVGWSGVGFKKGYHCPIRRRPVVEAVDAKDLIISNQATDIDTASRVTQVITMSKSVLIRMQLARQYRMVELVDAPDDPRTVVDKKIDSVQGVRRNASLLSLKDADRVLYETYADYDIPGHEHRQNGEVTGLPIPYRFTIDKASRKILEIRRNWKEGDENYNKRKTFVMYPFVPAFGFWPLGLMHLIGNSTNGITAAFRIAFDNGMINNYPYWLYAKGPAGQDQNDFRAGPGQGIPINTFGQDLNKMISPVPTKPLDPSFVQLVQAMKTDIQRVGGVAEIQVGEGNQQAPVGTTIALIEQAMKVVSAVHKRLHQAQSEEFRMLRDLLQEDPDALWRHTGKEPFNAQMLIQALNDYDLTPQADPNVSSHMVRVARAEAGRQIVKDAPEFWDVKAAIEHYCDQIGMPEMKALMLPVPAQPQQPQNPLAALNPNADPNGLKAMSAIAVQKMKSMDAAEARKLKSIEMAQKAQDAALDRQERAIEHRLDLSRELVIHPASPAQLAVASQAISRPVQ